MHSIHNYRHSRRSACDRCRGQKLRCERDHMNGMSCERCLKAQEICITSMNQPAPVILPSNHGHNIVAREDRESQRFNQRHQSMAVLHKSSGPRVKKLLHSPSPIPGRYNTKEHQNWGGVASMPGFPGGSFHSPSAEVGFNMPLDFGNIMAPVEHWGGPHSNSSTDGYNLPSDWIPSDQMYAYEGNSWLPSVFTSDAPLGARQATEMAIYEPFQTKRLNHGENESPFAMKEFPDPAWVNHQTIRKPPTNITSQDALLSIQDIRKSLLRLKVELLEDLEIFETGSMLLESSSLFYENSNLPIETLDLPIYRLLDHSSWLLAIVRSSCGMTDETLDVAFATQRFESESSGYEDSLFIFPDNGGNGLDEDATTVSPHDSGYHTTTTSPDQATTHTIPKFDIALWLGILEAHCSLVRIYRAVFMRLYQLFLIIPPTDAATILLLPKVHFGQFHLDGNLIAQVQLLVEFSSTMLGKLDQALKFRSGPSQSQEDREFDQSETIRQKDWSNSIRDIVLEQEQDPCEMSLMEIMECLRQLVKEPVII